jgi:uroporphyrinogen decarboxylase
MNKKARVDAALRGDPVDRAPISFWGHDYLREWSPAGLADAMLDNFRAYDWDYMKVNPRASYHVEDWGGELVRSQDPNRGPTFKRPAVTEPADWRRLRPLQPDRGVLGEQLDALRQIRDELQGEAYFVQTIFSPLSVAKYLVGNRQEIIQTAIEDDPGALRAALGVIVDTYVEYARACLEAGASGIFFATTGWASAGALTPDQYRRWGIEYDMPVVESVAGRAPFNILHNCGTGIYFDLLADYPVHAISWASTFPGNPTLAEGKQRTDKAVMGGVSEKSVLVDGTPEQVATEVRAAIEQTGGLRVLVAPGCSIPPRTPKDNLAAAARAARGEAAPGESA